MSRPKAKICGVTNWLDARRAVEAGADFLGFNFYPRSPRYVTPQAARRIIRRLPKHVRAVGVFVNESEQRVLETVKTAGLDYVQLHGEETPAAVKRLARAVPVIKAIRVDGRIPSTARRKFAGASALLLDGFDPKRRGGTGKRFDWRIAARAASRTPIFLAGGLTAENIAEAVRAVRPYAVDVCSGVEMRPGKKDPRLLAAFLRSVKNAGRESTVRPKRTLPRRQRRRR